MSLLFVGSGDLRGLPTPVKTSLPARAFPADAALPTARPHPPTSTHTARTMRSKSEEWLEAERELRVTQQAQQLTLAEALGRITQRKKKHNEAVGLAKAKLSELESRGRASPGELHEGLHLAARGGAWERQGALSSSKSRHRRLTLNKHAHEREEFDASELQALEEETRERKVKSLQQSVALLEKTRDENAAAAAVELVSIRAVGAELAARGVDAVKWSRWFRREAEENNTPEALHWCARYSVAGVGGMKNNEQLAADWCLKVGMYKLDPLSHSLQAPALNL